MIDPPWRFDPFQIPKAVHWQSVLIDVTVAAAQFDPRYHQNANNHHVTLTPTAMATLMSSNESVQELTYVASFQLKLRANSDAIAEVFTIETSGAELQDPRYPFTFPEPPEAYWNIPIFVVGGWVDPTTHPTGMWLYTMFAHTEVPPPTMTKWWWFQYSGPGTGIFPGSPLYGQPCDVYLCDDPYFLPGQGPARYEAGLFQPFIPTAWSDFQFSIFVYDGKEADDRILWSIGQTERIKNGSFKFEARRLQSPAGADPMIRMWQLWPESIAYDIWLYRKKINGVLQPEVSNPVQNVSGVPPVALW